MRTRHQICTKFLWEMWQRGSTSLLRPRRPRAPPIGVGVTVMNKDLTVKEISEIPADVQELLGKPLVLPNENLEAYKKLFLQTANSVAPIDVIEWLWVEDIVHHTWEIRRLRLFKLELVRSAHDDVYEYTCKENKLV